MPARFQLVADLRAPGRPYAVHHIATGRLVSCASLLRGPQGQTYAAPNTSSAYSVLTWARDALGHLSDSQLSLFQLLR